MKKWKKVTAISFFATSFIGGFFISNEHVSAEVRDCVAHPHPHYLDEWRYGLRPSRWAYSEYYLKAPVRLGSGSSVTDILGNVKSSAKADYGWANSGAFKQPWWVRADAYYNWYNF